LDFFSCSVSFEFQHNVCGRSIYAEGTVDAVLFLAKKVKMLQILSYLRFGLVNSVYIHNGIAP
jgi:dihydrodipicolinate reductase